ncbi:MAG TPA: hypothetical protein DHW82_07795 [Spirochaetia bacterium]|nr:MAG: hypothetical protein A2Y41_02755 [Spirochaetes bacterium GWB1_36_13]HCL56894.1 hypothetical protein [Spirochaetia bacterium]
MAVKPYSLAINARILNEKRAGVYRYTYNLIKNLSELDQENRYFILLNKDYEFDFPLPPNFQKVILSSSSRFIFDYFSIPFFSWRKKIDYYLFPKNTFSPLVKGKKIPVYHDIIYFEKKIGFREFKFFDHLHHTLMIRLGKFFSRIDLTVSDFTASRMKTLLKIPEKKIRIIKEGVETHFKKIEDNDYLKSVKDKFNLETPFFFYSGSLSPRKNMLKVLEAFELIKDKIPHRIYFTAGKSWGDQEIHDFIQKNTLEKRVVKLGFLSEEELVALYNLADAYLYPSLYEGFGLPILESQACGCPIITSNRSSCPEIAGEGALIVDPYQKEEIAEAMLQIAGNYELRNSLIEKGRANIQNYSWKKAAKEFLAMMENLSTS